MDPNTNTTQVAGTQPSGSVTPQPVIPPNENAPKKSNLLLILIAIVVVAFVGLGAYLMLGNNTQNDQAPASVSETQVYESSREEKEVDEVVVDDAEKDFVEVDKDLKQL
jgi:flagellar basal body-associated protein FliL